MSKKGPRSEAFGLLAGSLSEELIAHYLELAYHVREQEYARRREMERRKAALRRAREAALRAAWEEAMRKAGMPIPERPAKGGGPKSARPKKKPKSAAREPRLAVAAAIAGEVTPDLLPAAELMAARVAGEASGKEPAEASREETLGAPAETAEERAKAEEAAGAPGEAEEAAIDLAEKRHHAKSRNRKPITREDILKLAVADSLGYLEKLRADGWGGLTCAESGRVGGMMTRRMKRLEKGLPLDLTPRRPDLETPVSG